MFEFKRFNICQENSAQKVGFDGVLLGAWALSCHKSVLDIGTGTGLIALMMAQKNNKSQIVAIEIDNASYLDAAKNISQSHYNDRIKIFHSSAAEFSSNNFSKYSHVICNPPFFSEKTFSPDERRHIARNNKSLPPSELMRITTELLTEDGIFSLIIPAKEFNGYDYEAFSRGLYLQRRTDVVMSEGKKPGRVLLQYGKIKVSLEKNTLLIRHSDGSFTNEYRNLTEPFYLRLK